MPITAYPPIVKTAETSRMIDLAKAIIDLEAAVAECKSQFDRLLVPESMFFLAKFGPSPFTAIITTYFKTPEGKPKQLTPAEVATVGTELANSGSAQNSAEPSPLLYKRDKMIILLSYVNKYVKNRKTLEATKAELLELGTSSFISMKAPPIPRQIKVILESGQFTALNVNSNSPMLWNSSKKAIGDQLSSFLKLKSGQTLETGLRSKFNFGFRKRYNDYFHSSGYALFPFLIYHAKSISADPTPTGYWGHVAKYRLHASRVAEKMSEVRLVEVNPITGAPFDKGIVVGVYADEPSNALAAVSKMYPFVLELKSQENVKLDKSIVISDNTSKLKDSADRWALTGKKSERTFVNIIRTTWDWADLELKKYKTWYSAFNSGNKANKGTRTFQQQQLLDFQSDDLNKRKAALRAGTPQRPISHLLFGGDARQMRNCFPISISEFYLLPAGTEEALQRLCLVSKNNALIRVVNQRLKGTNVTGKKYAVQSGLSKDKFQSELKLINNDMQLLKAAISSPYLYTLGYEKLLTGNSLENLGMSSTLQCRMRVKKMFEEAKWPRSKGELVFKAPVNDDMDSQVMRGKFSAAMKQAGKVAPEELSYFEMPNMKVDYTYEVGSKFSSPNYEVAPGNGFPFTTNQSSVNLQLFRYYDAGKTNANWKTLYIKRELKFSKGVYSKSRDRSTTPDKFTAMTVVPPPLVNPVGSGIGASDFKNDALVAGSLIGGLSLLAIGYNAFRNRQLGD